MSSINFRVASARNVTLAALALLHTGCAVLADGTVACWGSNELGELGQGTADSDVHSAPVAVPGISGAVSVAVGWGFACALNGDGGIACWGSNDRGQLGLGLIDDTIHSPGPVAW